MSKDDLPEVPCLFGGADLLEFGDIFALNSLDFWHWIRFQVSKDDLPEVPCLFGAADLLKFGEIFDLRYSLLGMLKCPLWRCHSPMVPSLHLPPSSDVFDPKFHGSLAPPFSP